MFERFTERAREVVVLAQNEAERLRHSYIGTEHLLLGPVRESEGVAARVLLNLDADYACRTQVESLYSSTTVEPGDVADQIRARLRETEARELEAVVIAMLGESVLDAFPAMLGAGVTVSGVPEPTDPPAPTFSVSSTLRR